MSLVWGASDSALCVCTGVFENMDSFGCWEAAACVFLRMQDYDSAWPSDSLSSGAKAPTPSSYHCISLQQTKMNTEFCLDRKKYTKFALQTKYFYFPRISITLLSVFLIWPLRKLWYPHQPNSRIPRKSPWQILGGILAPLKSMATPQQIKKYGVSSSKKMLGC